MVPALLSPGAAAVIAVTAGRAGWGLVTAFNPLWISHMVFHPSCTIFHFNKQCIRVPFLWFLDFFASLENVGLFVFLLFFCRCSIYALDIRCVICKIFFSFCELSFHCLDGVLEAHFSFWWYPVCLFFLFAYTFGVISKKLLPYPRSWRYTHMFSPKNFMVFGLTFWTLIYFELVFVCGMR